MVNNFVQVASTAARRGLLGPGDVRTTTRVHIKASAANVFLGGPDVTTGNGVELPSGATAPYLTLNVDDPTELWVVGAGNVYAVLEIDE